MNKIQLVMANSTLPLDIVALLHQAAGTVGCCGRTRFTH